MRKAIILSAFYTNALHPRVEAEQQILQEEGYRVQLHNDNSPPPLVWKLVNIATLNIFKWHIIWRYRRLIGNFDVVIVYDLALLPLVIFGKAKRQSVIYETLDFNLDINLYHIKRKLRAIGPLVGLLRPPLSLIEKMLARRCTTKIMVNTPELQAYFGSDRCVANLYTSPFEGVALAPSASKPTALLYIGLFTVDKGAAETIEVSKRYGLPLFVFGTANEEAVMGWISQNRRIAHVGRIAPNELKTRIEALSNSYNLVGISLIRPTHHSYAVQEANKDIDYMALGVPFIGNERKPTLRKVLAGCGVLCSDSEGIQKLISNFDFYRQASANALNYYREHYSYKLFRNTFVTAVRDGKH